MPVSEESERLFSYGTLQAEAVQLATFGRRLSGEPDALPGYCRARRAVQGPEAPAAGGADYYLDARFTGRDTDTVEGTLFRVTEDELTLADIYEEAADYKRIRVQLKSGTPAWVYVSAASKG